MKGAHVPNARIPAESAVDRVGAVARALTSTAGGVPELQRQVVRTAASIAGDGAAAAMALREGEHLSVRVVDSDRPGLDAFSGWEADPEVTAGHSVRRVVRGRGSLLVLPMSYEDELVGALAVMSPSGQPRLDGDVEAF